MPTQAAPTIQVAPSIQAAPSPDPTPNNIASDTEKRCDTQTISKEKHLPKWNIEIVDSSVIASMLKDAEKNHLPFLKINASDNLKQKLEDYINKNPSKLHKDSQMLSLANLVITSKQRATLAFNWFYARTMK